jgi:hypothetical protein
MTFREANELLHTCSQRTVIGAEAQTNWSEWLPTTEVAYWTFPDGTHAARGVWEGDVKGATISCEVSVGNATFTDEEALQLWHCAARIEHD